MHAWLVYVELKSNTIQSTDSVFESSRFCKHGWMIVVCSRRKRERKKLFIFGSLKSLLQVLEKVNIMRMSDVTVVEVPPPSFGAKQVLDLTDLLSSSKQLKVRFFFGQNICFLLLKSKIDCKTT